MFYNLLPEKTQKQVVREYRLRLLVLLCDFLAGVFFAGSIFLVPSFVTIISKKDDINTELELLKNKADSSDTSSISPELIESKTKLFSIFTKKDDPDQLFEKIIAKKGSSISLSDFSYTLDQKGVVTVVVVGEAQGRDALTSFQSRLKATVPFKTAEFPVELLAKDKDIHFSMTIR